MTSGAMAQQYLTRIAKYVSYHDSLYSVLIVGIVLSALVMATVRNRPTPSAVVLEPMRRTPTITDLLNDIKLIFTNKQMWLIGIIGCLVYLPSSVFLDTWGVPYLKGVYGMTQVDAVSTIGFTFLAGLSLAHSLARFLMD